MSVCSHLEPKSVFRRFEDISAIPHSSGRTRAVSDYCADAARRLGHFVRQDSLGNLLIRKPAAPGYESSAPVLLQGHLDMVCEKIPDCPLCMETDGLKLILDGDFLRADGTTLGGDDGIAVAYALALLEDASLAHPPLEIVLTVDEEIGMLGAAGLDFSLLQARRMLNLDSEEEGVLLSGCAGGVTAMCTLPLSRVPKTGLTCRLTLSGLTGGHSGTEIHKGRANACRVLGQALRELEACLPFTLLSVDGGLKDNAIPRAASARLLLPPDQADALSAAVRTLDIRLKQRWRETDPALSLELTLESVQTAQALTPLSQNACLASLSDLPCGVRRMSPDLPDLVQTSLNLGILSTDEDALRLCFSLRSSVDTEKAQLLEQLRSGVAALGGTVAEQGDYPGWTYTPHSPLRETMIRVFQAQYGRAPAVQAIHAGVECGFFAQKLPGLDCVSFGPDILDIHTPGERMRISSVRRTWFFLLEVLKQLK